MTTKNRPEYLDGYYNGFSPEYRNRRGGRVICAHKRGTIPAPEVCHACGQTEGVIAHSEDYDNPYRDYWSVCYCCHKMLHDRHRQPEVWVEYRERIRSGYRAPVVPTFDWRAWNRLYRNRPIEAWPEFTHHPEHVPNMTMFDLLLTDYTGSVAPGLAISPGDPPLPGMIVDTKFRLRDSAPPEAPTLRTW